MHHAAPGHAALKPLLSHLHEKAPAFRKAEKTRRHNTGQEEIAAQIETMVDLLTRHIAELDRAIARLIEEDRMLSSQARLLNAVPGIGPTVLATPPSELPELGTLDRRRIDSLAGLAPHARESGT